MAYILVHRNRLLAVARSEIKTEQPAGCACAKSPFAFG